MSEPNRPDFREIDIQLLQTGNLADGTVKCKGRTWKVHRMLLASRLNFFKGAFYGSFVEATTGEIDFPEADPDSVDIMLRHLYGQGLYVNDLKTPLLCVRCWKLADYVQLETLKSVAMSSLGEHLNAMAFLSTNGWLERDKPRWLSHFFDAFQEVCTDIVAAPLRIVFVSFLWVTRIDTGLLPQTLDILKKHPRVNRSLLQLLIYGKFKNRPTWIPDIINIERIIHNNMEITIKDEAICSKCRLRVNTCNEPIFYNPFPASLSNIGTLLWCKVCVATVLEFRTWPWRTNGLSDGAKAKVETWSWVGGKQDQQH
ncbi:hypothetical protein INS49_005329 [Diaporthe citri]|uniref:uncharacterized protein n=1 Tax=Diaporthe citri TaxID=83186 RepID=UPI001C7FFC5C|nr:uncharacterized protein INS49_005329 [Diaporthe citri]KAG6353621.1 hypothetical protein INS49_005329 [Diaporthe citri]